MDSFDDVYYIDANQLSNANTPTVIRTHGPVRPTGVIQRQPRFPVSPYQYQGQPQFFGPNVAGFSGYPGLGVSPSYVFPVQQNSNLAGILSGFGSLDMGVLSGLVAQVVSAFLPLPDPPKPQDSNDSESQSLNAAVNSSNMIRYQSALAQYARRDQQILTLGSVLKELFRRPGVL